MYIHIYIYIYTYIYIYIYIEREISFSLYYIYIYIHTHSTPVRLGVLVDDLAVAALHLVVSLLGRAPTTVHVIVHYLLIHK